MLDERQPGTDFNRDFLVKTRDTGYLLRVNLMSKHPGNLNRLYSRLLARYGVDDVVVVQLKNEIDLQENREALDGPWYISYGEFIKGFIPEIPRNLTTH